MHSLADPRINTPSRLSDLYGDDRRLALLARDRAHRDAYMAPYEQPEAAPVRAFVLRWEYALTGALVFAAVVGGVSL